MNKEIAMKWAETLRSGKYEQGRARLRKNDKFCCLGVLCDMINPDGWTVSAVAHENAQKDVFYSQANYTHGLPPSVMETTGVKTALGDIGLTACLATYNDQGKPFSEIADIIEEYWDIL